MTIVDNFIDQIGRSKQKCIFGAVLKIILILVIQNYGVLLVSVTSTLHILPAFFLICLFVHNLFSNLLPRFL